MNKIENCVVSDDIFSKKKDSQKNYYLQNVGNKHVL